MRIVNKSHLFFLAIILSLTLPIASCSNSDGSNSGLAVLALAGGGTVQDIQPGSLDTPTGVTASTTGTSAVTVTWTAVPDARFYKVYRSTTSNGTYTTLGENTSVSYSDNTAVPGSKYYYKVQAGWRPIHDMSLSEVYSSQSSYTEGYAILTAPAAIQASNDSTSQVTITWSTVDHADIYKVLRAATENGTYAQVGSDTSSVSFDDTTGTQGTKYYYRVEAYSSDSVPGEESAVVEGYRCTNKPENLSATDGAYYGYSKLTWDPAADVDHYVIYRNNTEIGTSSTTNYTDTGATTDNFNPLPYKVMAVHTNGVSSMKSNLDYGYKRDPSTTLNCTVSWAINHEQAVNESGGGYRVYYSKTSGFDITSAPSVDVSHVPLTGYSPTTTIIPLGPGPGTWYIKVTAYSSLNSGSTSVPSIQTSINIE